MCVTALLTATAGRNHIMGRFDCQAPQDMLHSTFYHIIFVFCFYKHRVLDLQEVYPTNEAF